MKRRKKKSTYKETQQRNLFVHHDNMSPIAEQYKTIRTNIEFSTINEFRTIMVTSSGPSEGKSTTAANLAIAFAQQGKKVLLVDADMRKPTIHYTFQLQNSYGLTSVLIGQKKLSEVVSFSNVEELFIITCGQIPPNPAELLGSRNMKCFIEEAKGLYDLIIFDTPPVLPVVDAQILTNLCDGTILIISNGKTKLEEAKKAKSTLELSRGKVLGAVLNNKPMKKSSYYNNRVY